MLTVHILTKGFVSPNGIAFLFPLHVHRRRLAEIGVRFRCFTRHTPEVTDCDALIVDSRFYSHRWARDETAALEELAAFAERVTAVLYFDISDSTGWLQAQVLPFVSRYYKAQLLKEREAYGQPLYGNRIYADYYHRRFDVEDEDAVTSKLVTRSEDLAKLRVSWNSGLADYSLWGPTVMSLRQHLPFDGLLRFPRRFAPVKRPRPVPFACRFGTNYARETVAYQRHRIHEIVGARVATGKLSRRAYLAEMRDCRVVVSPFGFGEITLKDFEALLAGALLFKPNMSHLETWPDLFHDGETIIAHSWDLSDFDATLDAVLADETGTQAIAERGQNAYRQCIASETGYQDFCLRFRAIVVEALER